MTRRRPKKSKKGFSGSVGDGQIVVNGYSEQWLRQSFDWVYSQEVIAIGRRISTGDSVEIVTQQGLSLGTGIFAGKGADGSVAVRRFSNILVKLDDDFFTAKIQQAFRRRHIPPLTNAWRLVHSENDDLPGIVVDCWGDTIAITLSCPSLEPLLNSILAAVLEVYPYENAVGHIRLAEGNQRYLGVLKGDLPERFVVQELGINYWVHPQLSKDAGLFLDMRPLRSWLSDRGWMEKRVLNLFCYTGAFSVSAAAHGAKQVTSVDLSNPYLMRAKSNFELNELKYRATSFCGSRLLSSIG